MYVTSIFCDKCDKIINKNNGDIVTTIKISTLHSCFHLGTEVHLCEKCTTKLDKFLHK